MIKSEKLCTGGTLSEELFGRFKKNKDLFGSFYSLVLRIMIIAHFVLPQDSSREK